MYKDEWRALPPMKPLTILMKLALSEGIQSSSSPGIYSSMLPVQSTAVRVRVYKAAVLWTTIIMLNFPNFDEGLSSWNGDLLLIVAPPPTTANPPSSSSSSFSAATAGLSTSSTAGSSTLRDDNIGEAIEHLQKNQTYVFDIMVRPK